MRLVWFGMAPDLIAFCFYHLALKHYREEHAWWIACPRIFYKLKWSCMVSRNCSCLNLLISLLFLHVRILTWSVLFRSNFSFHFHDWFSTSYTHKGDISECIWQYFLNPKGLKLCIWEQYCMFYTMVMLGYSFDVVMPFPKPPRLVQYIYENNIVCFTQWWWLISPEKFWFCWRRVTREVSPKNILFERGGTWLPDLDSCFMIKIAAYISTTNTNILLWVCTPPKKEKKGAEISVNKLFMICNE